jgi:hypothetical protein
MTKPSGELRRFSELSKSEDPQGVGLLFESAKSAPVVELPRLRWRLRASLRFRATRPRRLLRTVLVAGGLLLTGGVVGAVVRPYWEHKESTVTPKGQSPAKPKPAAHKRAMRAPVPAETVDPAPAPVASDATAPAVSPLAPVRLARRAPPPSITNPPPPEAPAPLAPPAPSPAAVEQALLGDVLRSLRAQRDPSAALALLDEHARRFPETVVAPEAGMLRVEALLGLGRKSEALSVLDGLPLTSMPNPNERLALRGELRASAGRWQEAWADFDRVCAAVASANDGKSRDVLERALWGRASARSRLGDEAGARADLASYLRQFPSGRFATQGAALLRGSP